MENLPQRTIEEQPPSRWPRALREPVLVTSVSIGAVVLAVSVFRWTLVDWLTPLLEPILELSLGCAFLVVSTWAIVYFVRRWKKLGTLRAAAPCLINIGVLLIVLLVPFTEMTISLNFKWNYRKRMEVVSEVLDGRLAKSVPEGGGSELVHLPASYRGLSAGGGDIMIDHRDGQTLIFFFDFRGILDSFAGFVYSTGNTKPKNGDFGGQFFEVDQMRPNWWWVSSAN